MTLTVAELQAVFTGKEDDFDQVADHVETRMKDIDGTVADPKIDADATDAERTFDQIRTELQEIDQAQVRPKLEADADAARTELERLRFELDQVDGERSEAEVLADVQTALKDLDKAERGLADLDGTVAKPRIDSEGLSEFRDESGSTAREAAASFDGSAESIGEVFQEVAANAFAGFGPAGAIAGVAAAAGLGIALSKLTEISEATNEAAEEGAAWSLSFNATDQAGRLEALRGAWSELAAEVRDTREVYEVWQDRSVTAVEQIAAAADLAGDDVARFMSSFEETDPTVRLENLRDTLESVRAKQEEYIQAQQGLVTIAESRALGEKRVALEQLGDIIEEESAKQEAANAIEVANAEVLGLSVQAYRDRVDAEERATESIEAYGAALEGIADPVSTYNDLLADKEAAEKRTAEATAKATDDASDSWEDYAKDVKVTTRDLIDDWTRQAAEADEFEKNLAVIAANGGQAMADELRGKGPEVAGAVAATIAKSSPREQQRAINAHSRATGREISGAMADGISDDGWRLQRATDGAIRAVHPSRDIEVDLTIAWSASQLDAVINNLQRNANSRTIMVGTTAVTAQANGAVVDYYANGGLENHVAEIAPAGAYRIWAEPETGGEAYIPLAPSKRARSMAILEETASRMGARVVAQADGSVLNASPYAAATTAMFTEAQFARLEAAVRQGAAVGLAGHEAAQDRASRYARGRI